jgi:hemin uptake protein HemP
MKEKMTSPPPGGRLPPNETVGRRYNSRDLFRGQQEILIEHAGHAYRLRITRQDKLILTK